MINPYESPRTPPEPSQSNQTQASFRITVVDVLVILAIIGVLIALLLPAVTSTPRHRRNWPMPSGEVLP
jgi:hypothetical protein